MEGLTLNPWAIWGLIFLALAGLPFINKLKRQKALRQRLANASRLSKKTSISAALDYYRGQRSRGASFEALTEGWYSTLGFTSSNALSRFIASGQVRISNFETVERELADVLAQDCILCDGGLITEGGTILWLVSDRCDQRECEDATILFLFEYAKGKNS